MSKALPPLILLLSFLGQNRCHTKPHILFIIADDLGWNDVGFHSGDVPTPNLDSLAYNGISLKRHYSMPTCTPSRGALFTGDYPIRHGIQGRPLVAGCSAGLPLNVKIIPQYFSDLGYKTHLVGKWHLGYETKAHTPTYRGFDSFFGSYNGYVNYWDGTHQRLKDGVAGRDIRRGVSGAWGEVYGRYLTEVLTEEAVSVIEKHDPAKSLLLVLAENAVHAGNIALQKLSPHEGGVRTPAIIWSSLLKHTSRVTDQIFHITDWLPTLYSAVGGNTEILQTKDGISQWESLFAGSNGSRQEVLVNIDKWTNTESYIEGQWKIVKNFPPNSSFAVTNDYLGESGEWFGYNPDSVRDSKVGKILGGIPSKWTTLQSTGKVAETCSQEEKANAEATDCFNRYCLFDINQDPEECEDLADEHLEVVERLREKLDYYRSIAKEEKSTNCQDNPRADPKYHNDYWAPWL